MAARFCQRCGTPASPEEKFCRTCGDALPDPGPSGQGVPQQGGSAFGGGQAGYGPPTPAVGVGQGGVLPPNVQQIGGAGFFAALFDLSFSEFVTPKIIRGLYVLFMILFGLLALGIFILFASQGGALIIAGLIIAPIVFLLYLIFARVWLELIMVIFNIAGYAREIARQGRR